jgi:flagellar basal body rod protein FlgG
MLKGTKNTPGYKGQRQKFLNYYTTQIKTKSVKKIHQNVMGPLSGAKQCKKAEVWTVTTSDWHKMPSFKQTMKEYQIIHTTAVFSKGIITRYAISMKCIMVSIVKLAFHQIS